MERELRPNEFRREEGALRILDQSRLPGEIVYKDLTTAEQVFRAIRNLEVRGAPAIGVAAAFGAYLGVREAAGDEGAQLREKLSRGAKKIYQSQFTGEIFAKKVEQVYLETLKGVSHGTKRT